MIYLDNAATTKMSENALSEYAKFATSNFFNPSATYLPAVKISQKLTEAKTKLKGLLGAKKGDIIFTSGATEANNLAIRGSARQGNWEYVFSSGEHASVFELAKALENEGRIVTFVPLVSSGEVDYFTLERVLNEKTRIVSVMLVSNVTGAINDIARISKLVRQKCPNALLHVDGVQACGKIELNLDRLDVDLFSFSAHKFHGPKGVGGLYVKNKAALKCLVFGGGQEFGLRSGTENVPGIMAMVSALEEFDVPKNFQKVFKLRFIFKKQLFLSRTDTEKFASESLIKIAGAEGSPYILMLIFAKVNGETLVRMLEDEVIVGRGSACSAKKAGNHVLEGMGFERSDLKGAIRVSFDAELSESDVKRAADIIKKKYFELLEKVE